MILDDGLRHGPEAAQPGRNQVVDGKLICERLPESSMASMEPRRKNQFRRWKMAMRICFVYPIVAAVVLLNLPIFAGAPALRIDGAFPGGNIVLDDVRGDDVSLHQDLRDTRATGSTGISECRARRIAH